MIQADDMTLGCICPECSSRCTACLGTNSMLSKDDLKAFKENAALGEIFLSSLASSKDDDQY